MVKIDFSKEGSYSVEPGKYLLKVIDAEEKEGEKSDYIKWQFEIRKPEKSKGVKVYHNTSLSPLSLPYLRNLLVCLGLEVPKTALNLKLSKVIGLMVGANLTNEEYQGTERARVKDFFPPEEFQGKGKRQEEPEDEDEEEMDEEEPEEDEDEEEEEPAPKKSKKTKVKSKGKPKRAQDDDDEDEL